MRAPVPKHKFLLVLIPSLHFYLNEHLIYVIGQKNWLFSRYSTGWKCGLHPDWTELTGCVDKYLQVLSFSLFLCPLFSQSLSLSFSLTAIGFDRAFVDKWVPPGSRPLALMNKGLRIQFYMGPVSWKCVDFCLPFFLSYFFLINNIDQFLPLQNFFLILPFQFSLYLLS